MKLLLLASIWALASNLVIAQTPTFNSVIVTIPPAPGDNSNYVPTTAWVNATIAANNLLVNVPASNAALMSIPTTGLATGASIFKSGFAAAGDGGGTRYTYSSITCSISGGDGGTQIPASGSGCWNADPSTPITIELFAGNIAVPISADGTASIDAQPALQKALNTGKTVHLANGIYYVKRKSILTMPAQQIVGSGRNASMLEYGADFTTVNGSAVLGTNTSVFSGTGKPGPQMRDFSIKGFQTTVPSTYANQAAIDSAIASLIPISCIDVRDTIATKFNNMLISTCLRGIDLRGNSGQAVIDDVQGSNFVADFDIDGATDSVHIATGHVYPFGLTPAQKVLASLNAVGINSGKVDDLKISNSMTITPHIGIHLFAGTPRTLAVDGYTSPGGQTTGSVDSHDFDVTPIGLKQDAGTLNVTGGYFVSQQAIQMNGGYLGVTNTSITVVQDGAVTVSGGFMNMNASQFADYNSDYTAVTQTGGTLLFNGNAYNWGETGNITKPKVNVQCCRFEASANGVNDFGSGTKGPNATFFTVNNTIYSKVFGNLTPGWPNVARQSIYASDVAACDGTTDASAPLNNALVALNAAGGGTLVIDGRCLIDSNNLIMQESTEVIGPTFAGFQRFNLSYDNWSPALIINPAASVTLSNNARLAHLRLFRKGMVTPTSMRTGIQQLAAFAGTAVTVANTQDSLVEDVAIIGFDRCINILYVSRARVRSAYGDCNNGLRIDNSHDISRIQDTEFWETLTTNYSWSESEWDVASASNNGGIVRVVTTVPHGLITGDTVNAIVPGSMTPNNVSVTVINSTTLDLVGTTYLGAYTSGGKIMVDLNRRTGNSFEVTNSESTEITNSFGYGYVKGVHLGDGSGWTHLNSVSCDAAGDITKDPNNVCLRIDGTAYGTSVISGVYVSNATDIIVNSTGAEGHSFVGMSLNPFSGASPGPMIQVLQGKATFTATKQSIYTAPTSIYVADLGYLDFVGNTMPQTSLQYQSNTSLLHTMLVGNTLAPGTAPMQIPNNARTLMAFNMNDAGGVGLANVNVGGCPVLSGTGAPTSAAPVCTQYYRLDGGPGATLYVKESGTGTSGWVAK